MITKKRESEHFRRKIETVPTPRRNTPMGSSFLVLLCLSWSSCPAKSLMSGPLTDKEEEKAKPHSSVGQLADWNENSFPHGEAQSNSELAPDRTDSQIPDLSFLRSSSDCKDCELTSTFLTGSSNVSSMYGSPDAPDVGETNNDAFINVWDALSIECRCEYPGERNESSRNSAFNGYHVADGYTILPSQHSACQNVRFICPGEPVDGPLWNYDCKAYDMDELHMVPPGMNSSYMPSSNDSNPNPLRMDGISPNDPSKGNPSRPFGETSTFDSIPSIVILPTIMCPNPESVSTNATEDSGNGFKNSPSPAGESIVSCSIRYIDFEASGNGSSLLGSDYVQYEWFDQYGLTIVASPTTGGHANDGKGLLVNTSNTSDDPNLLTPNESCGGYGKGEGGRLGNPGANCFPLGNVLVIPPSELDGADSNETVGDIMFVFDNPVAHLFSMGLLNVASINTDSIEISVVGINQPFRYEFMGLGANSVQNVTFHDVHDVTKVIIHLATNEAITHLAFCN